MSDVVTYEEENRTAIITINRADKMNALDEDVIQGLRAAWRRYDASDARAAILMMNFSLSIDLIVISVKLNGCRILDEIWRFLFANIKPKLLSDVSPVEISLALGERFALP